MSEINYHVLQKAGLRRYFESLQMVLMGRFCNFSKSKTVNCHMQACVGASRLASDSERLNFITLIIGSQYFSRFTRFALRTTARRYVLVGVTRRQHRAESWYPAPAGPQNCHGARRVWHVFLPSWYKFY